MADPAGPRFARGAAPLPRLVLRQPVRQPGTLALPATTITVASILLLVFVLGYFQFVATPLHRALFRLEFPVAYLAAATAVSAFLLFCCRNRPGSKFPRYWLIVLTALSGAATIACTALEAREEQGWFHFGALGIGLATAALIARLPVLHPSHRLLPHVSWLVFLLLLAGGLIATSKTVERVVAQKTVLVNGAVAEFQHRLRLINDVREFPWAQARSDLSGAGKRLQGLESVRTRTLPAPTKELFRLADLLGREPELREAYLSVVQATHDTLRRVLIPSILPPLRFNPLKYTYSASEASPPIAALHIHYMAGMSEMVTGLAPTGHEASPSMRLDGWEQAKRQFAALRDFEKEWRDGIEESWSGAWLRPGAVAAEGMRLERMLRARGFPLGSSRKSNVLNAAEWLSSFPMRRMREMAGVGCLVEERPDFIELPRPPVKPPEDPSVKPVEEPPRYQGYLWFSCPAFWPVASAPWAGLFEVVYVSGPSTYSGVRPSEEAQPNRVILLLSPPPGESYATFKPKAIEAVRQVLESNYGAQSLKNGPDRVVVKGASVVAWQDVKPNRIAGPHLRITMTRSGG